MAIHATRRGLMSGGLAMGAAVIGAPRALAAARRTAPDLLVRNARVYTMDPAQPQAEAFAVSGGRFIAIGSNDDLAALAGPSTQVFDAKGATITPGFIDCHNHASGGTLLYEVLVGNPFAVEFVTIQSVIDKLKARAAVTPPGYWVEGFFFDDTKLKDGRPLDVRDLDKVSTQHPVAVHHRGGHTAFFNSKAFELAGVARDTPNPPGGVFDRFDDGSLNGRVSDNGLRRIESAGRRVSFSPEEQARRDIDAMAHISSLFARYGLTGVCHEGGPLTAMETIRAQGRLKHRINYEAEPDVLPALIKAGISTGLGDEWIRFGATAEHLADGSFSERTMALSRSYPGRADGYRGNVIESQEALDAWVLAAHRAGIRVNCHANGDVAIDHVLTAYERAQAAHPVKDARWKITHCSLVTPQIVARMKALDVSPALFSTYAFYNGDKFHFYGQDLMSRMMAYRTLLDAGIKVCAGSDFDPGPFAPMMALQAMVTRKGWNGEIWGAEQKISVDEAIRVHTYNGAWDTGEETLKGSISPGKLADFTVLSDDPHRVDPDRIKDIEIVRTVVGGQTTYSA